MALDEAMRPPSVVFGWRAGRGRALTPKMGAMTFGKELLDLTAEYMQSLEARSGAWDAGILGQCVGREPDEIAADYERAVLNLLAPDAASVYQERSSR